ncbi:hypothetical protein [Schleiferia thermophila]
MNTSSHIPAPGNSFSVCEYLNSLPIIPFVFAVMLCSQNLSAQSFAVRGFIYNDSRTPLPLENMHIRNLNTGKGTISLSNGYFQLNASIGDTLLITGLGYKNHYLFIDHTYKAEIVKIMLVEKAVELSQVDVTGYRLTTNNPRPMEIKAPLIPSEKELKAPGRSKATISSPIDYLYQMLSSRHRQLEELEKLAEKDEFIEKLDLNNNREILLELTGLDQEGLRMLIFYCQMSEEKIYSSTDYELIISMLRCYQHYRTRRMFYDKKQ